MRRLFLGGVIGLCLTLSTYAQVEVRLGVSRDNFVKHESVRMDVFVISNHNKAVILGDKEGWIRFSVRNGRGFPVNQIGRLPRGNLFVLSSGQKMTKGINLAPYFDFSELGEYTIQASITTKNWTKLRFESAPVKIQVVRARVIDVLRRGVASETPGDSPEVRRYTLQTARVNGKSHLFIRVSDDYEPSFAIYNVTPLGMMVHHAKPTFELDRDGISHLFFQSHQHQYSYTMIDPFGSLIKRQTYTGERSRPFMKKDVKGNFRIIGGLRVVAPTDYPGPRRSGGLRKN
ncbi:MAG: hypothetical protein QF685_01570 [Verrucomicrobiota bacterium]|nr:hypothetical protein [Verrucomicrobiota bacterium]